MILSYATCAVSVAPMRKEPQHRSEQVSQLLFGERVEILKLKDDYWAYIRCWADEYEGWCLIGQLRIVSKREFNQAPKFIVPSVGNKLCTDHEILMLPIGALLKKGAISLGGHKAKYKGKKLLWGSMAPSHEAIEHCAKSFLYAPYLWGGRGVDGIDCSGFTQLVMALNGIAIPRDASQQAQKGETIAFLQEAKCGDLAFFANTEGRINHVGLLLNEHHIIHATETSGMVVVDKIDQEGIVSKSLRKRTHSLRLIKRFF